MPCFCYCLPYDARGMMLSRASFCVGQISQNIKSHCLGGYCKENEFVVCYSGNVAIVTERFVSAQKVVHCQRCGRTD